MYKYLLFDLDGTLTDPKIGITKSVQYSLKSFGIIENDLDRLEPFIGPPLKDSYMEFYSMTDEEAKLAIKKYRERFETVGLYENKLYSGIPQMLSKLKKAGMIMAIASSKPTVFVEKILKYFSIEQYFDIIVGSELDGRRNKKEEVVKETLHRMFPDGHINTEAVVMIGDRKFDVEGANEFGIDSIGVEYGYSQGTELSDAGATIVVSTVKELEKCLLSKQNNRTKTEDNQDKDSKNKRRNIDTNRNKETNLSAVKLSPLEKIWNLLLPAVLYYLGSSLFIIVVVSLINAFGGLFGTDAVVWIIVNDQAITVAINGLGMIFGFFLIRKTFLTEAFWKDNHLVLKTGKIYHLWMKEEWKATKKKWQQIVPVILLAITSSVTCNLLLGYLNISELSEQYESTAEAQYSVPIWLGLLLYGIISPLAEETLFRGILYNRMKKYYSMTAGIVLSSLLFGFYHLNLVQGIYGTIMGLLIVLCYEWTNSFFAAFLFHAAANVSVYLLTQNEIMKRMLALPISFVLFSILTIMIFIYLFMLTQRRGKSDE